MKTSRSSKTAMHLLTRHSRDSQFPGLGTPDSGLRTLVSGICLMAALAILLAPAARLRAQTPPASFNGYTMANGDNLTYSTSQTYNGAGSGAERLVVLDGISGTMSVADGITVGFVNSFANDATTGTNGGAISIGTGSILTLTAAPAGQWLFTSNSAAGNGGAIASGATSIVSIANAYFNGNAAANYGAIFDSGAMLIQSSTFFGNYATAAAGNGGAIGLGATGTMTIRDSYFENNYTTGAGSAANQGSGGAFYVGAGAFLTLVSDTFVGNKAATTFIGNGGGGAIAFSGASGTGANLAFENNSSKTNGGAISVTNACVLDINGAIFTSNSAINGAVGGLTNAGGGAIYAAPTTYSQTITLTNVSFLDNASDSRGGALLAFNSSAGGGLTLNLNTTSGSTALIAGNRQFVGAAPASVPVTGSDNSLYFQFQNAGALLNVNIHNDPGSTLDMLDPMASTYNAANTTTHTITKDGAGAWKLGGDTLLGLNNSYAIAAVSIAFKVNEGLLYLYRNGEAATSGTYKATTGNITLAGAAAATNSFYLGSSATLGVGGANTVAVNRYSSGANTGSGTMTLGAGSHIAYDLSTSMISDLGLNPAATTSGSGTALLSLVATTYTLDNGSKFNFGLNLANATTSGTYNLLQVRMDGNGTAPAGTLFATYAGQTFDASTTSITYDSLFYDAITGLDTTDYDYLFGITGNYLWLSITAAGSGPILNSVLTWTGGAADGIWGNANWMNSATGSIAFTPGDIVNLDNTGAATPSGSINVAAATSVAGMYFSGTANYTIAGAGAINASATAGTFDPATDLAASGQLVLGASAALDASVVDTSAAAGFSGTLTLANSSNNFEGGIIINSGALVGNAGNLGSTGTDGADIGITIGANGTLIFDQANTGTYAAPIKSAAAGAGALVKQNTGALMLAADNSGFTGATQVATGKLLLASGAALGGAISVANGATFGGAGTAGSVALGQGATLQIGLSTQDSGLSGGAGGAAGVGQTLTLTSDLNLSAGSILDYLAASPGTDITNQLLVTGLITQSGTSLINIDALASGTSYALLTAGGWGGGGFDATLFDVNYDGKLLADGVDYSLLFDSGTLWFSMLSAPVYANSVLTWTGSAGDTLWLTSTNWIANTDGAEKTFTDGDIVNLTDAATTPAPTSTSTLNLNSTAAASAIYVNGAANYAITGSGALVTATGVGDIASGAAASGKLVLGANADDSKTITTTAFTGTLDLTAQTGTNNFAQGIEINTGALRVASNDQLGTTLSNLAFTGTAGGAALIVGGASSSLLFDAAATGPATQRLSLPDAADATITLEPGNTLTIANSAPGLAGAAINLTGSASLALEAGAGAQFAFTGNTATGNGGAIETGTGSRLTLAPDSAATGIDSFKFTTNTSARGGALDVSTGSANIARATFTGNTSTANGGAIAAVSSATITLADVLFTDNRAASANHGGALFLNTGAVIWAQSATFNGNYAGSQGGAIAVQNSSTLNLADALIASNTGAQGGAIALTGLNSAAILTDVSLVNNTATSNGGAFFLQNNAILSLTLNVSAGSTAQIAGNLGAGIANSIYFNTTSTDTLNVNTAAGASLDMLDPMIAPAAPVITVTKTGSGAWNLGGASTLGNASTTVTFNVNAGALHLYGANETSTGPGGVFTTAASATLTIGNSPSSSFNLGANATLSAGGGNTLTAPNINLAANSTIELNLLGVAPATAALLTLNATAATGLNANGWTQNINLLNANSLADDTTYNLITLGNGKTFASADYFTLIGLDPNYYHLQLGNAGATLQLYYSLIEITNNVLIWTGAAGGAANTAWNAANWSLATNPATSSTYTKNDIINLTDAGLASTATPDSATINVDIAAATIAGLNVSGTANYTITSDAGGSIITTASGGSFTGSAAATGQLILGAQAAPDGSALNTTAYTGTLTLANPANTFQNGIDIRSGALVGNAANLAVGASQATPSAPGIAIGAQGTLTFDQATDATYDAPITNGLGGGGALNKTNTGALTLTANSAAFGGTTSVSSGALLLAGNAALGGSVAIATGATFGGSGTAGAVTVAQGATLQVGLTTPDSGFSGAGGQTLTLTSNLNLLDGSLLAYTSASSTLLVGGAITQSGASTINLLGASFVESSSYSLIDLAGGFATATFDTSLLSVTYKGAILTAGDNYLLNTDGNLLWLTILAAPDLSNNILAWTNAAGDGAWLLSPNWVATSATGGATTKSFMQGDIVNLAGAGGTTSVTTAPITITLAGSATAAGIYVNGAANYAIAGPGALVTDAAIGDFSGSAAASGQLTLGKNADDANTVAALAFSGTLDLTGITGANNFAQGIEINTGALRVATAAQLGAPLSLLNFTGTGALIVAGAITLDGAGGSAQRLNIPAAGNATLILESGKTLTIANNAPAAAGGAINIAAGASLALEAGAGAQYLFTRNSSAANGGAIEAAARLTLDGSGGGSFSFSGNTAARGGALDVNGGIVAVDHATFDNNTSTGNGGAVAAATTGSITLANVLFTNNRAAVGGALYVNSSAVAIVQSATFSGNTTSAQGAAIGLQNTGTVFVTDALISNNTATQGGALFLSNTSGAVFTDVTLVNNIATTNGGAIFLQNNAVLNLTYNVSPGLTSQIAGNALVTNGVATPNSMYFNNAATDTFNVNIAAGGSLDMLDPINIPSNPTVTINKDGPGAWRIGGGSTLGNGTAVVTFNVNAGALHLLGEGETSTGPAGAFTAATSATLNFNAAATNSSLNIGPGAMLSAGGSGNARVTVYTLNLDAASLLGFNLDLAPNSPAITAANTLLTLNIAGSLNAAKWNQTLDLAGIDDLDRATAATYNLLTLTGAGGNAAPFDATSFGNLANVLGGLPPGYTLATAPSGLTLQLLYTPTSTNHVLDWNGGATDTLYGARNWFAANTTTITTYNPGDILNLANATAATGGTTSASPVSTIITPVAGAPVSGLYVSGTENYTITGATAITANPAASELLAGTPAATGKLILGARASSTTITTDDGMGDITTTITTILATADYTGTLALANTANTFEGGIEINTGALAGSAASLGSGTVGITNNGALIFDQADDDTYTAPITGTGSLVKTGAATLILGGTTSVSSAPSAAPAAPAHAIPAPANANAAPAANSTPAAGAAAPSVSALQSFSPSAFSFSGPTTVLAGALLIDNLTLGGSVDIATAATFGGVGAVAGPVTVAPAGSLQAGIGLAGSQTLTLHDDLTLADGAIVSYATPADYIHLDGALTRAGAQTVNLGVFQSGTYNLGNLGELASSNITVGGRVQYGDARQSVTLAENNGDLLMIAAGDISRVLYWTGGISASNTWALTGTNWGETTTGNRYVFGNGDQVHFDDTANPAAPATIAIIDDGVIVSDMFVTATGNTTITGDGITSDATSVFAATGSTNITGATGKLYKTNTGTLTLANNGNDFKNGVSLAQGALAITGATHAGAITTIDANTTLQVSDGGLFSADNLQLAATSTLTSASGRGTITGNITLNGMVAADIAAGNTLQLLATSPLDSAITGPGAFHKTGAGELELTGSGALANTGTLVLDEGAVRLDGMANPAPIALPNPGNILLNNGNLILASGSGGVNYATAADWGASLAITPGATAAATGTITGANDILHIGSGTLAPKLSGGLHIAVDAPGATAELGNLANDFTGAIIVNTGTYRVADALQLGAISAGATKVALNGGALQISAADAPAFRGNIDLHSGTGAIAVDAGVSSTWAAITKSTVDGAATALKTGSGAFTLTGALAATALVVDQGRWVAVASTAGAPNAISNNFVGPVTINENAVYELGLAPAAGVSGTLGYFAGRDAASLYIPTNAGQINNPITGSGTLEITAGQLNFTSPQTDIAHVTITGPAAAAAIQSMNFSPAGIITVDNSRLILAASTQTLGNIVLQNNATLGFLRTGTLAAGAFTLIGPPNKRATIASLAAPALADDGTPNTPNLWFSADVSALAADHLAITGPVTGAFTVNITFEGSTTTPPKVAANLELISAPAMGNTGAFTIADASREVDIGLYKYTVTDTTSAAGAYSLAITGNGDMSNTAAAIYSAAAAIPLAWFTELNTVSQRLGALHLEHRAGKAGLSAWLLGYDEKLNFNDKLTGSPFTQNHYGAEAGVDYKVGETGNNLYLGAFAGYGSNRRPDSDPTYSTSDSAFGGVYLTAASAKTGLYLDLVGKFNSFKNRFTVTDPSSATATTADYRNWAIGASLEIGKHQKLPADWFVEPQAQIAITEIAGATYRTDNGTTVSSGPGMASQGRLGFRLGRDVVTENLGAFSFYLKGYYGRQWATDGRMTIVTADGTTGRDKDGNPYYTPAIKGITLTGGAGFSWLFTKNTQVYFDYETTQARYYIRPYGFTLGLRHLW